MNGLSIYSWGICGKALLGDLDRNLHFTETMIGQALDAQLKHCLQQESCIKSYAAVLDEVVGEFFEGFMCEHSARVRELTREHLARVRGGWKR